MIFISLGTQKFQFNRLLKYIDEKIKSQEISEEVKEEFVEDATDAKEGCPVNAIYDPEDVVEEQAA